MSLGVLRCLVRTDVRRPATWLALASGVGAGSCGWAAAADGWPLALVLVLPAIAVVAAIGDVPFGACGPAPLPAARLAVLWTCTRAAWPVAGWLLATVGRVAVVGDVAAPIIGAGFAALVAVAAVVIGRLAGATAADAAGLALAVAAGGAACGWLARAAGVGVAASTGAAGAAWILATASLWSWRAALSARSGAPAADDGGWDVLRADRLPCRGAVTRLLEPLAMAGGLAGMAGWLAFKAGGDGDSAPLFAAWALLSAACFICLAVPRATLLDGCCGTPAWERLVRCGPAGASGDRRGAATIGAAQPGMARFAAAAALAPAAILGWPPLVGGILSLPHPADAGPPFAIALGLAGAASSLAALTSIGAAAESARETLLASALALCSVLGVAAVFAFVQPPAPSTSTARPRPPSLVRIHGPAPGGGHFAESARHGRGDAASGAWISC